MYTVAVKRDFIARHYLIGGDWGPENDRHSHHYFIEVRLKGNELNKHGYMIDITTVESALESLKSYYLDCTLNDLPEFEGINPSIEHLARISHQMLSARIREENIRKICVRIWENDLAWASYGEDL